MMLTVLIFCSSLHSNGPSCQVTQLEKQTEHIRVSIKDTLQSTMPYLYSLCSLFCNIYKWTGLLIHMKKNGQMRSMAKLRITLIAPASKPQIFNKPVSSVSAIVCPMAVRPHITNLEKVPCSYCSKETQSHIKQCLSSCIHNFKCIHNFTIYMHTYIQFFSQIS